MTKIAYFKANAGMRKSAVTPVCVGVSDNNQALVNNTDNVGSSVHCTGLFCVS